MTSLIDKWKSLDAPQKVVFSVFESTLVQVFVVVDTGGNVSIVCWVPVHRYRSGERDSIAPEGAELRVIAAAPSPELEIHHLPSSAANFHKQWQTSCQPLDGASCGSLW